MPLSKNDPHTSEDYWNLLDGVRAELIDFGEVLSGMQPPAIVADNSLYPRCCGIKTHLLPHEPIRHPGAFVTGRFRHPASHAGGGPRAAQEGTVIAGARPDLPSDYAHRNTVCVIGRLRRMANWPFSKNYAQ